MPTPQQGHVIGGPDVPDPHQPPRGGSGLRRQLTWYVGGLVAVYGAGLAVLWPHEGAVPSGLLFLVVMLAPTVGAVCSRRFAGAYIQLGRPGGRWLLVALTPVLAVLLVDLVSAAVGWTTLGLAVLGQALALAPVTVALACISALGEEIGWRGFLWPTLRARAGFWSVSLCVGLLWWLYHLPLILLGWYGSMSGLAAFTVAIAGFTLFVGVLTDRARAVWPSTLAHGGWNALVATSFTAFGPAAFTGSSQLGEFGWIAAVTMAVLGGLLARWHVTTSPSTANDDPAASA